MESGEIMNRKITLAFFAGLLLGAWLMSGPF